MSSGTVYPKKYTHGFVVLCFVVVMQSFIMNSHEVFTHIHQGCFAGTGAIVRLPQCQWSKPDGYGKISQSITTTKHSKAKTVCIFLGMYCSISVEMFIATWSKNQFEWRASGKFLVSYTVRDTIPWVKSTVNCSLPCNNQDVYIASCIKLINLAVRKQNNLSLENSDCATTGKTHSICNKYRMGWY